MGNWSQPSIHFVDRSDRTFGQRQVPTPHYYAAENNADNSERHLDGANVEVGRGSRNTEFNLKVLWQKNGETCQLLTE